MRIRILCIAVLLAMVSCGSSAGKYPGKGNEQAEDLTYAPSNVVKVLDRQQKAAFDFFFGGTDPQTGMIYEGTERGQCITTGGAGFGIMALCVGVERGWITREQGLERIGRIVSFLTDCERYHGAWSHWNNPDGTYMAFGKQKATGDLVETSFVMQGLLAASEYFDKDMSLNRSCGNTSRISTTVWNGLSTQTERAKGFTVFRDKHLRAYNLRLERGSDHLPDGTRSA